MVSNILIRNLKIQNNFENNNQKIQNNIFTKNNVFSEYINEYSDTIKNTKTSYKIGNTKIIKKFQIKIKSVSFHFSQKNIILKKNVIGKSLKINKKYNINSNIKELVNFINDNKDSLPSELVNIVKNFNSNNNINHNIRNKLPDAFDSFKEKYNFSNTKNNKLIISKDFINDFNYKDILKISLNNNIAFIPKKFDNFIKLNAFNHKYNVDSFDIDKLNLKSIFEFKIKSFINNPEKEKVLYSNNSIEIKISKNKNNKLKDLLGSTSKNKTEYKNIKKNYNKNIQVIIENKSKNIDINNIFKHIDSIIYKIENKKESTHSKILNLNRNNTIENYFNKINFLHPSINNVQINSQNNNIKTISIQNLISNINNTVEKINNLPKYFERTVFKVTPPDLGNLEVTIIKSQKNLKIEFNIENIENKNELENRIETLINNFKEKYEKVDFTIKSEFYNNDEYNEDNKENNENNNSNTNENTKDNDDKKRKNKRNDFWEILRGEKYD
ncbi:flagellar hook-length control protein FliK [Marinitoga litoralis]|uniref:flagellar hook-length control protein FliK n=1 Tax=Marinitoga litoralis TaxID=570855 RepID=UPI0019609E95|nr:flagellar hook-length control protein FliK [Marinitoga litoralis]MBM7558928.1 hypothetical protein [Marinitoga litoralis]